MRLSWIDHPYLGQLTRSFILHTDGGAVFIDSGLKRGIPYLEEAAAIPIAILSTHGHWDHIGGHAWFQKRGTKIYAADGDRQIMKDLGLQWNMLYEQFRNDFLIPKERREIYHEAGFGFEVDNTIREGERLCFGSTELLVIATPGHSLGSICIFDPQTGTLFTGDTICGAGFNQTIPQINDFASYVRTLERLQKFDVDVAHTAHFEAPLDRCAYHERIAEGLSCCERVLNWAEKFLHDCGDKFTIGDLAAELCEKEGGKVVGSGACVTALALLRYLETEENDRFECAEGYVLQR